MFLLTLAGCFLSMPEKAPCTDPHLWYAPEGSGDTYFGCAPPEGWRETPPDESSFAVVTQTSVPDPTVDIDTDEPDVDTGEPTVTFPPRDTSPPEPVVTGDTGGVQDTAPADPDDTALEPEDTGLDTGALPDTTDTGIVEPPPAETGDTGVPEARVEDTALPPVGDTAVVPEDDDTATP